MNAIIKRGKEEDFQTISEIGKQTFYETWIPVNTEEDMQAYMSVAFDPVKVREEIKNHETNTFFIAYHELNPIGYAKLRRDRTYEEFGNESAIEIERIYVLNEWQHKKIGKALMEACIQLAMEEKYTWIWLGVNIDNEKAIRFYKQYGFTVFGEKSFQLGKAVDMDYLMKKKLL